MWRDKDYPNIYYFMREAPLYWIKDKKCAILQGAYSVDKDYRLRECWTWFPDEQLPVEMRDNISAQLWGQKVDYVMSHICLTNGCHFSIRTLLKAWAKAKWTKAQSFGYLQLKISLIIVFGFLDIIIAIKISREKRREFYIIVFSISKKTKLYLQRRYNINGDFLFTSYLYWTNCV